MRRERERERERRKRMIEERRDERIFCGLKLSDFEGKLERRKKKKRKKRERIMIRVLLHI